eukprot:TRINITY_DN97193_c0_g1_i1.p1 TRINITY_DN97193_c0_g1~~TRINITY_DN97193_c0_g1_i1.p1  ORF type:complete len:212 (+),score=28.14 TRINITY_DN97193_c0_g1_i1:50-685(+)
MLRTSARFPRRLLQVGLRSVRQFGDGQSPHLMIRSIGQKCFACYRAWHKSHPYSTGFAVCFCKGVLAELIARKAIACEELNERKVLAMALFSGFFTGCGYHLIFNVIFKRVWGSGKEVSTVMFKVAADAVIVFPFLYMPCFYFFDELILHGSLRAVPERWADEISSCMANYVKIWPFATLAVFTIVPVELRVSFIAGVSLTWLVILSMLVH